MTGYTSHLQTTIDRFLSLLPRPFRLLVAVSGGSDSTGLLLALHSAAELPEHSGISLSAATVDHDLRAGSAAEADAVASLCARHGIAHVTRRWSEPKPRTGISAAARHARYSLLAAAAREMRADAIVTGHTLDDQQETVAMRATRNDDDDALGLSGMAPATLYGAHIWLLRPLLDVSRDAIRQFLTASGQGWIEDPTNLDQHYERVRTRTNLALVEPAPIAADAADRRRRLASDAAELLAIHGRMYGQSLLHINRPAFKAEPETLRYLLAGMLAAVGGNRHRPGQAVMDKVTAFAAIDRGRMTAARCLLQTRPDGLYMLRESRAILPLHLAPGEAGTWDGRYRVVNRGPGPITVDTGDQTLDDTFPPTVPPQLRRDAQRSRPVVKQGTADKISRHPPSPVELTPLVPLFDLFLPEFDLPFANAVAALLDKAPYPRPPRRSC